MSAHSDYYDCNMQTRIVRYSHCLKQEWDSFVKESKNATFLFFRDYMDYHSDRFEDCSLLFYCDSRPIALLPANIDRANNALQSHAGLTYGGLIMSPGTRCSEIMQIFADLKEFMRNELGVSTLLYKPLPHIYCTLPAEEPLYALFSMGARIAARSVSTTIDNSNRIKPSQLRVRGAKKAREAGITCSRSSMYCEFWEVLSGTLMSQHGCTPVHTVKEIELLQERFPDNIRLYTACNGNGIVAGVVVYETETVAHLQYIAASPEGKECGALDMLIMYIMDEYREKRYIDFGISTEQGGTILNNGLIAQKEGFGGRAVVYDTYEITV